MFLVSVECEYKYDLKKKLKKEYKRDVTLFTNNDINNKEKYDKYKYVITEYNKDAIDYFDGQKIIIIMNCKRKLAKYHNSKNIYFCDNFDEIKKIIDKHGLKKSSIWRILVYSLLLIVFCGGVFAFLTKPKKEAPTQEIQKVDYEDQNFVFLGDSITEFYKLSDYYDSDLPVVNSGISGNRTYSILENLGDRVYKYNPTKVFLLIGTNDLVDENCAYAGIDSEIVDNITSIVREIHEHRKNAEVYVESIYPVNSDTKSNDKVIGWMVGARTNERIQSINEQIKEKSEEYDYTYLDFYSLLSDENGALNLDYTIDGLHISDEGYKLITEEIMKIINEEPSIIKK